MFPDEGFFLLEWWAPLESSVADPSQRGVVTILISISGIGISYPTPLKMASVSEDLGFYIKQHIPWNRLPPTLKEVNNNYYYFASSLTVSS